MNRTTKAERERIKVTCLWCENIARTHFICTECMTPMSDADRAKHTRPVALEDWRLNRACACGAPIPYEAPKHTKHCAHCAVTAKTRAYRIAHPEAQIRTGVCSECGAPSGNALRCKKHQKQAERLENRGRRQRNRAKGLCACGQPPRDNRTTCAKCAEYVRNYQDCRYARRVAAKKCTRCPNRALAGYTICAECRDIKRLQNARAA